jgi:hypothetical protein
VSASGEGPPAASSHSRTRVHSRERERGARAPFSLKSLSTMGDSINPFMQTEPLWSGHLPPGPAPSIATWEIKSPTLDIQKIIAGRLLGHPLSTWGPRLHRVIPAPPPTKGSPSAASDALHMGTHFPLPHPGTGHLPYIFPPVSCSAKPVGWMQSPRQHGTFTTELGPCLHGRPPACRW